MIRLDRIGKSYRSGVDALVVFDGLNLTVEAGELVAVVGESGAGKSTLLHIVAGLDQPTAGSVFYKDRDIATLGESGRAEYRNREIGFVWQQPRLLAEFTAQENVMMPLLVRGLPKGEAMSVAAERLEEVGLGARLPHRPGELSGGEQQRVAIARAMTATPSMLLADEPTGNLDEKTGERVFELFAEMRLRRGLTTILVTHNLRFARRCDRALRLENGVLAPL